MGERARIRCRRVVAVVVAACITQVVAAVPALGGSSDAVDEIERLLEENGGAPDGPFRLELRIDAKSGGRQVRFLDADFSADQPRTLTGEIGLHFLRLVELTPQTTTTTEPESALGVLLLAALEFDAQVRTVHGRSYVRFTSGELARIADGKWIEDDDPDDGESRLPVPAPEDLFESEQLIDAIESAREVDPADTDAPRGTTRAFRLTFSESPFIDGSGDGGLPPADVTTGGRGVLWVGRGYVVGFRATFDVAPSDDLPRDMRMHALMRIRPLDAAPTVRRPPVREVITQEELDARIDELYPDADLDLGLDD